MAWNEQVRYDINENEVLSVWSTGINYVVRIDNPVNNSAYILHTQVKMNLTLSDSLN